MFNCLPSTDANFVMLRGLPSAVAPPPPPTRERRALTTGKTGAGSFITLNPETKSLQGKLKYGLYLTDSSCVYNIMNSGFCLMINVYTNIPVNSTLHLTYYKCSNNA